LLGARRGAVGDLAQAASHLASSVDGLRRAGHQEYLPLGLLTRAALHTHTRNFDRARHDLDEALTLATRCGFRLHECDAHLGHARLALAQGDSTAAQRHLASAREIIEQTGYHRRDEELAALEAEARKMIREQEKGSRKERKEREEERGEAAGFAASASFARNSPAPSSRDASTEEPNAMSYDVAIVCALRKPELEKVLATGKQPWTSLPLDAGDPTQYRTTTFERTGRPALSVVAAAPSQMGMTASATLTTKMIQRFKPKLVAMVGIAGGVDPKRQGFGDILAPATTFDYGAGKLTVIDGKLHLSPDANPISIVPLLRERLEEWGLEDERLAAIRRQWSGPKPNTVLKLHVGPLGSGAAVVAARETVDATKEHWRKLIGIEMEAYGVHHASQLAVHPPPMFLCMKSICDFAGPDKNDDWQDYAAFTAAQLCHRFLMEEWDTLFPR
jgi:nucleoside phosphorylase